MHRTGSGDRRDAAVMPERESSTSKAAGGYAADAARAGAELAVGLSARLSFLKTIFSENQGLREQGFSVESGAALRWNEEESQSQHKR
jgi:hypothetical protein